MKKYFRLERERENPCCCKKAKPGGWFGKKCCKNCGGVIYK